jgi:hypothetical protein
MQLQAFVPFVTYPVANPDGIATQVVSLASELGAAIHSMLSPSMSTFPTFPTHCPESCSTLPQ